MADAERQGIVGAVESTVRAGLASAAGRRRRTSPPLAAEFIAEVIKTFYTPALTGSNLAGSLLEAARVDRSAFSNADWRATAQQAANDIRKGCAALRALPAPGNQKAYQTTVACADCLEIFADQFEQCLVNGDARLLADAGATLKRGQTLLTEVGRALLRPPKRIVKTKRAAKKPADLSPTPSPAGEGSIASPFPLREGGRGVRSDSAAPAKTADLTPIPSPRGKGSIASPFPVREGGRGVRSEDATPPPPEDLAFLIDQLPTRGVRMSGWLGVTLPSGKKITHHKHWRALIDPLIQAGIVRIEKRASQLTLTDPAEIRARLAELRALAKARSTSIPPAPTGD